MFNVPLRYAYLIVILLIIANKKYLRVLHCKDTRLLIVISEKTCIHLVDFKIKLI